MKDAEKLTVGACALDCSIELELHQAGGFSEVRRVAGKREPRRPPNPAVKP